MPVRGLRVDEANYECCSSHWLLRNLANGRAEFHGSWLEFFDFAAKIAHFHGCAPEILVDLNPLSPPGTRVLEYGTVDRMSLRRLTLHAMPVLE